jgi:uncharacterized protein
MIAISPAITAMQGKSATKNMTSDTAFKIVDFALAQSNNGHPVQINFFGGEPLLCLDLMREVADYTLQCAVQKQLDVSLGVTTNGTLLDDDAMAFLIDYGVDLCISLDGPANIHDHQRVYPDGSGTFKDVMGNLNKALVHLPSLQVNTVFGPSTLSSLPDVMDFIIDMDVPAIHLNPDIMTQWNAAACQELGPVMEQVADRYIACYQRGRELAVNLIDGKAILFLKGGYESEDRCGMGETEFGFAPSGNIYACERFIGQDDDPRFRLGNIHTGVDLTRRCQIVSMRGNRNPECVNCNLEPYCMNWCGCTNFHMSGLSNQAGPALCAEERAVIGAARRVFITLAEEDLFLDHLLRYLPKERCATANENKEVTSHD